MIQLLGTEKSLHAKTNTSERSSSLEDPLAQRDQHHWSCVTVELETGVPLRILG